jgi:hypothetical protein
MPPSAQAPFPFAFGVCRQEQVPAEIGVRGLSRNSRDLADAAGGAVLGIEAEQFTHL